MIYFLHLLVRNYGTYSFHPDIEGRFTFNSNSLLYYSDGANDSLE
jgi:hypothetical protein